MQPTMKDPTMPTGIPRVGSSELKKKEPKKIFGMDSRSLATVVGLTGFFIIAMAGVVISLRTRFGAQDFSPTAPDQPSANIEQVADCSLSFEVAPPEGDISCVKTSYQDELSNSDGNYQLITEQTVFEPGEIVVFSIDLTNNSDVAAVITAEDDLSQLSTDTSFSYTFLDSDCGTDAFNSTTEVLTCTSASLQPGATETHSFRIQLGDNITDGLVLTNVMNISTTITTTSGEEVIEESCEVEVTVSETPVSPSPSPSVSPTPSPSPSPVACNESCTTSDDCRSDSQFCYNDDGNTVCREIAYPESPTCTPPTPSPSPTPTPLPTPTPAAYCNDNCVTNSDCTNTDHICYNGQCRDEDYPTSPTCTPPVEPPTPSPIPSPVAYCNESCVTNPDCTVSDHICYNGRCRDVDYPESPNCQPPLVYTPDQPQYPTQLPQSGSDGFENWIKAGLGVLGVGALLLLLL
jgi:hypothetical protein